MHRCKYLAALVMVLALTAQIRAADAPDPEAAIAPFINDQTLLVLRADVGSVDLKVVRAFVDKTIAASKVPDNVKAEAVKAIPDIQTKAQRWIDEFKKAGAKQIYIELNLADIEQGPVIIVPLPDGADAAAIENLFATGHAKVDLDENTDGPKFAIANGCMIYSDEEGMIAKLKERKAVARPDLAKAMAESGDAPVRMAFVPSEDARLAIMQKGDQLPAEAGGAKTADLLEKLTFGTGCISMSPEPSIKITMHYKDAASAATAVTAVTSIHDAIKRIFEQIRGMGNAQFAPDEQWGNVIDLIAPTAAGNDLVLGATADKIGLIANTILSEYAKETIREKATTMPDAPAQPMPEVLPPMQN